MLDPNFDVDLHLDVNHHAVLMDWAQMVQYHYDCYVDAANEKDKMKERQYLWDLFWNFNYNPADPSARSVNIIAMLRNMASATDQVINMNEANIPGEIVSKEQCAAYLVHDLGMTDDIYLLPEKLEYPIVDKNSIRLAMDMITRVDETDRAEYAKNLNRKYKEYGCTFSISVDHPYAKYADKNIILHMTMMLMEGDTAVDDEGTSAEGDYRDRVAAPPHKKVDFVRGEYLKNLAATKETQPDRKREREVKDTDDTLN